MKVILSPKYQVVIPKKIREDLRLKKGQKFERPLFLRRSVLKYFSLIVLDLVGISNFAAVVLGVDL